MEAGEPLPLYKPKPVGAEIRRESTHYTDQEVIMNNKTNQTHRNVIIIYSPRMAGHLMLRGFYLISVQPNLKHPGKNCFSFYDSPMLKDAMEDYLNRDIAA